MGRASQHHARAIQHVCSWMLFSFAGLLAWVPLVAASQIPVTADKLAALDQATDLHRGPPIVGDHRFEPREQRVPTFNALCASGTGRWAQTITAGRTGQLASIDLLLLRRYAEISGPVEIDVRAVDDDGHVTSRQLAHGSSTDVIPYHRSTPAWLSTPLDDPLLLHKGQRVAFFPTATAAATDACYEWLSGGFDQYWGGSTVVTDDGGRSFSPGIGQDAIFRTWLR